MKRIGQEEARAILLTIASFLLAKCGSAQVFGPTGELLEGARSPSSGAGQTRCVGGSDVFFGPFVPTSVDSAITVREPTLTLGPDRRLHLAYVADVHGPGGRWAIHHASSTDGGHRWTMTGEALQDGKNRIVGPAAVAITSHVQGAAWMVVDSTLAWEVRYRSLDLAGNPVSASVRVSDSSTSWTIFPPVLACMDDVMIAAWWERAQRTDPRRIVLARSFDAGLTWENPNQRIDLEPEDGPVIATAPGGRAWIAVTTATDSLVVIRSNDYGESWVPTGAPVAGRDYAMVLQPALAFGSGGVLGITYSADVTAAPPSSLWFSQSNDEGDTWSEPTEVSRDAPFGNQYDSHLVADSRSGWHLAWLHNIPFTDPVDVFYSSLTAGSSTWTVPVRVDPSAGDVVPAVPWSISTVADSDGQAYVAWGHTASPLFHASDIYVATTRERPYDPWEGMYWADTRVTPNPFGASTVIELRSPTAAIAEVTVYDVAGRRMRRWTEFPVVRGVTPLPWDGRTRSGEPLPAGVYLVDVNVRSTSGVLQSTARIVRLPR